MSFVDETLGRPRPDSITRDVDLPRRQPHFASPASWRDEVLYFLLVDRFSDGREDPQLLLDRSNLPAARPKGPGGEPWRWDRWAQSGGERYQGMVRAAHETGMRILLDIIFNHSGANWIYPRDAREPPYRPFPGRYSFGAWLDAEGEPTSTIDTGDKRVPGRSSSRTWRTTPGPAGGA